MLTNCFGSTDAVLGKSGESARRGSKRSDPAHVNKRMGIVWTTMRRTVSGCKNRRNRVKLVVTEKNDAAQKIADLLGASKPKADKVYSTPVYRFDLDGEEWTIEGDGLLGRCLQHELDHLDGKTMFEVCDPMARIEALRAYEAALAAGAKPGETGPVQ